MFGSRFKIKKPRYVPRRYNTRAITNLSFLEKARVLASPQVQFPSNQGSPALFRSRVPNPKGTIPEQLRFTASVLKVPR